MLLGQCEPTESTFLQTFFKEFPGRSKGSLLSGSLGILQDKKTVTMAATMCQPNATTMVQRRQKDGSSMMVPCPESVVMYNQYMGGVDRGNQLRGYYHVRLKCVKNYKYIFWFLFEAAVTNAYILTHYTVATDTIRSQQTFKAFWLRLATQLIGNYVQDPSLSWPSSFTTCERLCSRGCSSRTLAKVWDKQAVRLLPASTSTTAKVRERLALPRL